MPPVGSPIQSEDDFHITTANLLKSLIGEPGFVSRHGILWYSVETRNAGGKKIQTRSGKIIPIEAIRRKASGVVSGIPDIHFFFNGKCMFMELKTMSKQSKLNDGQKHLHAAFADVGVAVEVARNIDEVIDILFRWELPLTRQPTATGLRRGNPFL